MRVSAIVAIAGILAGRAVAQDPTAPTAATTFFENKVRPILAEQCFRCHGPESGAGKGELRVDSLDALLKGGVSGPAIVRGEPARSLLLLAVRHEGDIAMPPKKKLAAAEIEALSAWVKMGAPWPASANISIPVADGSTVPRWPESCAAVLGVPDAGGRDAAERH